MRVAATLCVVALISGCASRSQTEPATVSRSAPPVDYESTIGTYFDLAMPATSAQRKLGFGAPEASGCRVLGGATGHVGWVVPVTYETIPGPTPPPAATDTTLNPSVDNTGQPMTAAQRAAIVRARNAANTRPVMTSLAPTGPVPDPTAVLQPRPSAGPSDSTSVLDDVSVVGKARYFFWFNKDTINAVTRRTDLCP